MCYVLCAMCGIFMCMQSRYARRDTLFPFTNFPLSRLPLSIGSGHVSCVSLNSSFRFNGAGWGGCQIPDIHPMYSYLYLCVIALRAMHTHFLSPNSLFVSESNHIEANVIGIASHKLLALLRKESEKERQRDREMEYIHK